MVPSSDIFSCGAARIFGVGAVTGLVGGILLQLLEFELLVLSVLVSFVSFSLFRASEIAEAERFRPSIMIS